MARFASPWRRAAAAAIDWGLCYFAFLIVSIPLGVVQALGATSLEDQDLGGVPGRIVVDVTQLLAFVPLIAYFAVLLPTSQAFGMRVMDIRTVSVRTGRGVSRTVAFVRGLVATAVAAAVYVVFLVETSFEENDHLDRASTVVLQASYVLAGLGALSAIAMLVTPTRRSLFDRLFGTAVLDELEAVVSVAGPWGPLNVFDTSNEPAEGAEAFGPPLP